MLYYAKIVDGDKKLVNVGTGTNEEYYKSIGMEPMEVEKGYDGLWYVAEYAPEKPVELKAEEVRTERNRLLAETDKFMVADYPITDEQRELYKSYRQYLRDITADASFPEVEVKTFEEWLNG